MQTLFQIALIIHIVGITLMAGTTLVEYLHGKHFWKLYANDKLSAMASNGNGFNFHLLVTIGIILLILSGVTMLLIFHGVFVEQIWFQIKIGLIIIIAINGSVVGRRQDKRLKRLMSIENLNVHQENRKADILRVKHRLDLFYIAQLAMFLAIFILSVFKFN